MPVENPVGNVPESASGAWMSPKVGTFDVLKEMCNREMDVRMSTVSNITDMRLIKSGDTKVTIGVAGDVLNPITRGEMCGGMILADKAQFDAVKAELEARSVEDAGSTSAPAPQTKQASQSGARGEGGQK